MKSDVRGWVFSRSTLLFSKKNQPGAYTVYAPGCVFFMESGVDLEKTHPERRILVAKQLECDQNTRAAKVGGNLARAQQLKTEVY